MKLPNREKAYIEQAKLKNYLLALDHPQGGSKAKFLHKLGYDRSKLELLEEDLLHIARHEEVKSVRSEPAATYYVIEGPLTSPTGTRARFETVWEVRHADESPRFITGYPSRRRQQK